MQMRCLTFCYKQDVYQSRCCLIECGKSTKTEKSQSLIRIMENITGSQLRLKPKASAGKRLKARESANDLVEIDSLRK